MIEAGLSRGTSAMNGTRILREQLAAGRSAVDRLAPHGELGSLAVLVNTRAISTYPTVPGAFYACSPLLVDGPETEGATASFTTEDTRTIYALNVGSQVPPVGTAVIAHACGGRWTFRYDG